MPAFEIRDLKQYAVLWSFVGQDRHGVAVVASPIQIKVRWLLNDAQVIDPMGNTIASSGTIISSIDIPNMSIIRLGKLIDLPETPDQLHAVIKANTTPDLKNRHTRYDYFSMRYSNLLPTVQS